MQRKRPAWLEWASPVVGTLALVVVAVIFGEPPAPAAERKRAVRLAYFPNLTHAPPLVGVARGVFQRALPAGFTLEPRVFNAGPEEMEALLAGEIDVGYVGPSPAINTYLKSGGRALRIIGGACSGGASLVARRNTGIAGVRDLSGKRIAVPQLGGTQDVSLRRFLAREGLRAREKGGSVEILPIKNPDILALLKRGEIDAAWVPEPWASRLVAELGAVRVLDERELWEAGRFPTTVVVARTAFLEQHPELVRQLLRAHLDTLSSLRRDPAAARVVVNDELKRLTGKALAPEVLAEAWRRVEFTEDPNPAATRAMADAAVEAGYLKADSVDLAALFDPSHLGRLRSLSARER